MNLMTASVDPVEAELADLAARRIQAGEWPWSFFCYAEERPRPVFPSAFLVLAPAGRGEEVGLAVRCPACASVSINLVSAQHLDVPFHNDREIGVVEHVFAARRRARGGGVRRRALLRQLRRPPPERSSSEVHFSADRVPTGAEVVECTA